MPEKNEIDITRNIKMIESFKCELLNSVAELYSSMADHSKSTSDRADILSNLVVLTYLLSEKLGISYQALDSKVINKIKLEMLTEGSPLAWHDNLAALVRHIDKNRDFRK